MYSTFVSILFLLFCYLSGRCIDAFRADTWSGFAESSRGIGKKFRANLDPNALLSKSFAKRFKIDIAKRSGGGSGSLLHNAGNGLLDSSLDNHYGSMDHGAAGAAMENEVATGILSCLKGDSCADQDPELVSNLKMCIELGSCPGMTRELVTRLKYCILEGKCFLGLEVILKRVLQDCMTDGSCSELSDKGNESTYNVKTGDILSLAARVQKCIKDSSCLGLDGDLIQAVKTCLQSGICTAVADEIVDAIHKVKHNVADVPKKLQDRLNAPWVIIPRMLSKLTSFSLNPLWQALLGNPHYKKIVFDTELSTYIDDGY